MIAVRSCLLLPLFGLSLFACTDTGSDTKDSDTVLIDSESPPDSDPIVDTEAPPDSEELPDTEPPVSSLEGVEVGDLVITEIMSDPLACVDDRGEYFEVLFQGAAPANLQGLRIADNGAFYDVTESVPVSPGDYVVFFREPLPGMTQCYGFTSVPYLSSISLANGGDELTISDSAGVVFDRVDFSTWPRQEAAAFSLDPSRLNPSSNDARGSWCYATTPIVGSTDLGTPGGMNTTCGELPAETDVDTELPSETDPPIDTDEPLATGLPLMITEVMDYGPQYQLRYVEIYNSDPAPVSLAGWSLRLYANGGATPTTFNFPAQLIGGHDTFVIGLTASMASTYQSTFGAQPDAYSGIINGNGDDTYALVYTTGGTNTVIDIYGVLGVDGTGEPWEYTDQLARRRPDVTGPNPSWTASEWVITANAGQATLGEHTTGPVIDTAPVDTDTDGAADSDTDADTDPTSPTDEPVDSDTAIDSGETDPAGDTDLPVDPGLPLMFTEIMDYGPEFRLRYVEVYNSSAAPVSLSGWSVRLHANGNTTFSSVALPSQTLAGHDTFVIGLTASMATTFQSTFGDQPDLYSGVINGNGNDTYVLHYAGGGNNTIVDVYGVIGQDGTGEAWEYLDALALRRQGVAGPSATWRAAEWVITTNNSRATLGTHLTGAFDSDTAPPADSDTFTGADTDTDTDAVDTLVLDTDVVDTLVLDTDVVDSDTFFGGVVETGDTDVVVDTDVPVSGSAVFLISEIADPVAFRARYVEIYNAGDAPGSLFGLELRRFSNGSVTPASYVFLDVPTSVVAPGATYVLAFSDADLLTELGVTATEESGIINANGNDVYALATVGAPATTVLDVYGVIGVDGAGEPWEFTDESCNRLGTVLLPAPTFNLSEWACGATAASFTPGVHPAP